MERQQIKADKAEVIDLSGLDRLEAMFRTQAQFQNRVSKEPLKSLTHTEREELLVRSARNIMMEGAELMDWLNWKEWKKTKHPVNWEEVKFEIADIMAFLMNAAMQAGMDPEEFFQYYMRKAKVNNDRQDKKY